MSPKTHPPDTQFWTNIYLLEIPSSECFSTIRSLLTCPAKITTARGFQGNEAQKLIGFLDRVLSSSCLDDKLWQRCLRLLSKICKTHGIVPPSYTLRSEFIHIGRVLCHGGFADVSDGEYLGDHVAIKRLNVNKGELDTGFKNLCREIICWKYLSHPNILPLLGVSMSVDSSCFYILSEWMPNGDVMGYARSNPNANRVQLLSNVMAGIAYLHGLDIVHGDLKGANILVDNAGIARVGDFGLMTMADLSSHLLSVTPFPSGGTFRWMSPELLDPSRFDSDGRPTHESDCYALGIVIHEVLTGLRPFHQLHGYAPVPAILRGERPRRPVEAESLGLSHRLWELVQSCWSESTSARPTAQQLLECLDSASSTWVPPLAYPIIDDDGSTTESGLSGSLGMPPPNTV